MPCQPLRLIVSSKRNPPLKWNLSMTVNLRCFKLYRTHVTIMSSRTERRTCIHKRCSIQILRHFVPQDDKKRNAPKDESILFGNFQYQRAICAHLECCVSAFALLLYVARYGYDFFELVGKREFYSRAFQVMDNK